MFNDTALRQNFYQDLNTLKDEYSNKLNSYWSQINAAKPKITLLRYMDPKPIIEQDIEFPQMSGRSAYMAFCLNGNTFKITPILRTYSITKSFLPDSSVCSQ